MAPVQPMTPLGGSESIYTLDSGQTDLGYTPSDSMEACMPPTLPASEPYCRCPEGFLTLLVQNSGDPNESRSKRIR